MSIAVKLFITVLGCSIVAATIVIAAGLAAFG